MLNLDLGKVSTISLLLSVVNDWESNLNERLSIYI